MIYELVVGLLGVIALVCLLVELRTPNLAKPPTLPAPDLTGPVVARVTPVEHLYQRGEFTVPITPPTYRPVWYGHRQVD